MDCKHHEVSFVILCPVSRHVKGRDGKGNQYEMVKLFCTWFALRHALRGRRFATWAGCLSTGSASNGPKESKGSQRRKPWKCKASCVVLMRWPNKRNEILVSHCIIIAVWQCQWPWAGSTNDWIFPLRTDVLHRTSKIEEFLISASCSGARGVIL